MMKMKRRIAIGTIAGILFLLMLIGILYRNYNESKAAESFVSGKYTYIVEYTSDNNPYATITDYTGTDSVLVIPDTLGEYNVGKIANDVFKDNTRITSVKMPDTVMEIACSAFYHCTKLSDVQLSNGLEKIGAYAFGDCDNLTKIKIPKSVKETYAIYNGRGGYEYGVFYQSDNLRIVEFEDGATIIPCGLMKYSSSIESVEIPSTVTEIGYEAFSNCINLKSVKLSESLLKLGEQSFSDCSELTSIKVPDTVTEICVKAFYSCSKLSDVKLSKNLEKMGAYAFGNCDSLIEIKIPKSLKETYAIYNGRGGYEYGVFFQSDNLKTVEFEEGATVIPSGLMKYCDSIETIEIPDTVTEIGYNAFSNCTNLKSVKLSSALIRIGEYAFEKCESLENISLPDTVSKLDNGAFYSCKTLKSITLSKTLTSVGEKVFMYCSALTDIILPDSLESMGNSTFNGCSSLVTLKVTEKISRINDYTFQNCSSLKNVTLSSGITTIGKNAFDGCTALETIVLPDKLTSMGVYALANCTALTTVDLGASLKTIPNYCFYADSALVSLKIPYQFTTVGDYAFASCTAFKNITLNRNITSVGNNTFSYPAQTTIYGVKGTYAETYAKEKEITFKELSVPAEEIKLSKTKLRLPRGDETSLTVRISPVDSSDDLTWSSLDEDVITIDSVTGVMKGVAVGEGTIIAISGSVVTECEVEVYEKVTGVSLNRGSQEMHIGDELSLAATVNPTKADDKTVTWSSSDKSVAEINTDEEYCTVKAVGCGTANITVTTNDQKKTAVCKITVSPISVSSIALSQKTMTLSVNKSAMLTVSFTPENADVKEVTWTSSKPEVARVKNGKVTALSQGTSIIIAKSDDGSKTANCIVTVVAESVDGTDDIENQNVNTQNFEFAQDAEISIDENGYLSGVDISANTVKEIAANFENNNIVIKNSKGVKLTDTDLVGTGCVVEALDGSEVVASSTIVVAGELTGDGKINNMDVSMLTRSLLKYTALNSAQSLAADVKRDGNLNNMDVSRMIRYLLGYYDTPVTN